MSPRHFFSTAAFLLTAASLHAQAKPLAQDFTIVHHNPDPERYVEGPGLARLDDGTLLAVVPVVPREEHSKERRAKESRTHILRSEDGGKTWKQASELPYYSAAPWLHKGILYLFTNKGGTKVRNDDLLLLKSTDGGKTWSEPVTLFQGHFWNCHTGMVQHEDRLYWATDDLSLGKNRGPCVIAGDLSGDFMQASAWRISNPVPFPGVPDALTNPRYASLSSQYLEPNVIEVHGNLRVMATVKPKRQSTAGLAAVFDFEDKGKGSAIELKFTQFHPMPGGQLKFCIIRDEKSKMFWATANIVVDGQGGFDWWKKGEEQGNVRYASGLGGNDRRFLMLFYGLDGMNWVQAGCVAQAAKISQSFMYARPVIDGDDLAIIARSSIDAPNQHDADHATFHRVKNFRQLALNLFPEAEGETKGKP
ncbi:MAG TPA: sialidase family protein [Prosthecobacter sp.]